jgi:hypothetical protein
MRQRVIVKLKSLSVSADWIRSVEEIIEVQGAERSQMFGESLPIGLRLIGT